MKNDPFCKVPGLKIARINMDYREKTQAEIKVLKKEKQWILGLRF